MTRTLPDFRKRATWNRPFGSVWSRALAQLRARLGLVARAGEFPNCLRAARWELPRGRLRSWDEWTQRSCSMLLPQYPVTPYLRSPETRGGGKGALLT